MALPKKNDAEINISLHPKQAEAFNSPATEILFGGAAGGGKSQLMRMAAVSWCAEIAGLQVYLFRRIREDLIKNHMEGPGGFREMLAGWVDCGFVKIVEDEIRFWNGSKIYLCHCKDEKDRFKYQGAEIHLLLIDELTHFTDKIYRFLRNRVRMVGITLPKKYEGRFPRIISAANPGGVGHQFVKATFIDGVEPMDIRRAPQSEGGMLRQFIPARLEDNPSMAEYDPEYEGRLMGLGSDSLVRAMRWGDWNVVEGAFFDEFDPEKHILKPFEIPEEWLRFRAMDWGSARPFSVGWYAVAQDQFPTPDGKHTIPRGALIRYREWYGIKRDSQGAFIPNVGLKMDAGEVGEGIYARDMGEKIAYGALDPAAFATDGGPSIAERLLAKGVAFRRADNRRVASRGAMGGWDELRARLRGDADGRPMLYFFENCVHAIRTLPAIQHDEDRPEDLDTNAEDHCFTGDTLVSTAAGVYPIAALVGQSGKVRSHDGEWHEFRSARMIGRDQEIVRLVFADGSDVKCTPDHQFMTRTGWVDAAQMAGMEALSLCPEQNRSGVPLDANIPARRHARAVVGELSADAKGLKCIQVEPAGVADVYCLTVPETGNFALENGVLVSNCVDEVRYAVMSRPWVRHEPTLRPPPKYSITDEGRRVTAPPLAANRY